MKFAVIGSPINHSFSPKIHKFFADSLGMKIEYEAIEIEREEYSQRVRELFHGGFSGLNVTLPLKDLAYQNANERKTNSKNTKTANTLWTRDESIVCDSTDGPGLIQDFKSKGISVKQCNIAILGSGGSARAILPSLLAENPSSISIINRTAKNIDLLMKDLDLKEPEVSGYELNQNLESLPDIIINCSSAGLKAERIILPSGLLDKAKICYDLSYSISDTPFCLLAKESGVEKVFDGKGMLLNQAALSFKIWTGIYPEIPEDSKIFT